LIKAAKTYVRYIDKASRVVGKGAMFLIFAMMGILIFETIARIIFNRSQLWSVEMTQFFMAAYYLLGGAYTLLIGGHVRMDLFYHKWSAKRKALADVITFFITLIYMVVLIFGGIKGLMYSIKYKQVSYSSWAPQVTPIKIIMLFGMTLMLLQIISELIKDIATIRGEDIT
jgi:TRAP-type mannitol/chloroaromatic compound transport system permease small subunit